MSRKNKSKTITPDILQDAVRGAFIKLNPMYMIKNPVMFIVEVGFFITLVLSVFPNIFGDTVLLCLSIVYLLVFYSQKMNIKIKA